MNLLDLSTLSHWQLLLIDGIGIGAAVAAIVVAVGMAIRDLRRSDKAAYDQAERDASFRKAALEMQQRLIATRRGTDGPGRAA